MPHCNITVLLLSQGFGYTIGLFALLMLAGCYSNHRLGLRGRDATYHLGKLPYMLNRFSFNLTTT